MDRVLITVHVCVCSLSAQKFMYYVNDGVYGSFNCILYDHAHPIPSPLTPTSKGCDQYECSMWGPTCDGIDQILDCGALPELAVGEWVVFEDMGAYTVSAASSFNGFQKPSSFFYITEEHDPGQPEGRGGGGTTRRMPVGPLDVWRQRSVQMQCLHSSEHLCPS